MCMKPESIKPVDWRVSEEIARQCDAQFKACWSNACMGLMTRPDTLVYTEGWVVVHGGIVIEHGWLEDEQVIYDPTFVLPRLLDGADVTEAIYFPAVYYTASAVHQKIFKKRESPPFVWKYGWGGHLCADYMAAHDAAYTHIFGRPLRTCLAQAKQAQRLEY